MEAERGEVGWEIKKFLPNQSEGGERSLSCEECWLREGEIVWKGPRRVYFGFSVGRGEERGNLSFRERGTAEMGAH
ncbi:MAG: hypothetical protein ACKEQI_00130, partial [Candidatus Hodgkinia cicadicola]